jgi:hypothetical protein
MVLESRRVFLGLMCGVAAAAVTASARQGDSQGSSDPQIPIILPPFREPRRNPNAELRANQVAIRKDMVHLNELVRELQKEFDQNDTREVLSLDVLHKAMEIEKLAKQIQSLVRG